MVLRGVASTGEDLLFVNLVHGLNELLHPVDNVGSGEPCLRVPVPTLDQCVTELNEKLGVERNGGSLAKI